MPILPQHTKSRGEIKGWKSYGACPNFPQLAKGLPRPEQVSKALRATDEITFVFTPPESYWFKVQVTQVTEKSHSD